MGKSFRTIGLAVALGTSFALAAAAHAAEPVATCPPNQIIVAAKSGTLLFYNQFLQVVARLDASGKALSINIADCDDTYYYIDITQVLNAKATVDKIYVSGRVAVKIEDAIVTTRPSVQSKKAPAPPKPKTKPK